MNTLIKSILLLSVFFMYACSSIQNVNEATKAICSDKPFKNPIMRQYEPNVWTSINEDELRSAWEEEQRQLGNNVQFGEFTLLTSVDTLTNITYYFIKTRSIDGSLEVGQFLDPQQDGTFRLADKKCSCKGCTDGCNLTIFGGNCRCSDCFPSTSTSKCEKTEEAVVSDR